MELHFLSAKGYEDPSVNYGDCIVIVGDGEAIIYDCGSKEHADRVIELLNRHNIDKAFVILSHNDDDHFKGINTLIDEDRVELVYTVLLLKYKDEILDRISDDRVTRKSVSDRIEEMCDNIKSLEGRVILKDAYEDEDELILGASRRGPDKTYMLDAVAKGLDPSQGNTKDSETITNATGIQIGIDVGDNSVLLTGDCPPEAIPDDVDFSEYKYIQLPHHGKSDSADKMFERADRNNEIIWVVSDNTGDSNGGSDKLSNKGHNVKNTKMDGDICISDDRTYSRKITGRLGR